MNNQEDKDFRMVYVYTLVRSHAPDILISSLDRLLYGASDRLLLPSSALRHRKCELPRPMQFFYKCWMICTHRAPHISPFA